jgi:hypothetical protein
VIQGCFTSQVEPAYDIISHLKNTLEQCLNKTPKWNPHINHLSHLRKKQRKVAEENPERLVIVLNFIAIEYYNKMRGTTKGHKWYQSVPIDAKALVLLVKTYNKKLINYQQLSNR